MLHAAITAIRNQKRLRILRSFPNGWHNTQVAVELATSFPRDCAGKQYDGQENLRLSFH
jgi:hypothetical protein